MTAVAQIDKLEEDGFIARLNKDADLDLALLEIADWWINEEADRYYQEEDLETAIPSSLWPSGEVEVAWFRKMPCNCGGAHAWDLHGSRPGPGAFLGVTGW